MKNKLFFFRKADNELLFKQPFNWIAIGNSSKVIQENLNIGLDSRFFIINESDGILQVIAPYKYSKETSEFNQNQIASWNKDNGYLFYNNLIVGRNRTNLNGLTLKISYVLTNPRSLQHLWDYRRVYVDIHAWLKNVLTVLFFVS